MLPAAACADDIIGMVEMRMEYGEWQVFPPGFDKYPYAAGVIVFAAFGGAEGGLAECKRLVLEAWARWCQDPAEREVENPSARADLEKHAIDDLRVLVAEVRRLTAAV